MSGPLAPLLEIQDLDLASSAAKKRSVELPERAVIPEVQTRIVRVQAELQEAQGLRTGYEAKEEELGKAVSQIARDMEAAEIERYSGKQKSRDDAKAHDASQAELGAKKSALEDEELELLESMEEVEGRIGSLDGEISAAQGEIAKLAEVIAGVEREVADELEQLSSTRNSMAGGIPAPVLSAYDRVREQKGKAGRGAARFEEGDCQGCRIKLPSLEKKRMLAEPPEALIQCPQCRRVLIRS